jgi:hypothetical protein
MGRNRTTQALKRYKEGKTMSQDPNPTQPEKNITEEASAETIKNVKPKDWYTKPSYTTTPF